MASRSAAAEARRRRILERGTDRLNRIALGNSAGVLHESGQSDGSIDSTSVSAECPSLNSERAPRPEPQQRSDAHIQASGQHLGKDAAHLEAVSGEDHGMKPAHKDCTPEEPRNLQQDSRHKTAHSAVQSRSDRWAQSSCSAAEDIQGLQSNSAALLGSRQALTSAVQRTHSSRLALAALMPILARRAAAGCAQSGASYWHGLGCSLANMPLVYLLLMHVLLIAAAAAPLLATGESMMAQGPRIEKGLLSSQPVRLLARMMGIQQALTQLKAALKIMKGFVDAVAVYIFMAALTCTLEAQMGSRAWFNQSWTPA
ncbi:hypothetical protein CVIRNUC_006026 [Coccomyxa viridis]|uniref:Uncharacterized protein n=1 Tax=Coccomyxa viridis TaxID=1274662 RepID=A0AAV1I7G9_9CHLO|nr:hypothetical protein CVIRNUC_006026 [Coccomyxa viridis]